MRKIISVLIVSLIVQAGAWSQNMTLQQAISVARANSVQALEARQEFISVYWSWRAYQASRLPSLHLYGNHFTGTAGTVGYAPLQTPLHFERVGNGGLQNKAIYFIHYSPDNRIETIRY